MDPGFFPNSPFRSPAIGPNTPVLSNGIFWTPVVPSALHAPGITSPDLLSLGQPAFSNIPIPRSLVQVDPLDSSLVPCPRCRSYNTKGKDSGAFLQRSKNTSHLIFFCSDCKMSWSHTGTALDSLQNNEEASKEALEDNRKQARQKSDSDSEYEVLDFSDELFRPSEYTFSSIQLGPIQAQQPNRQTNDPVENNIHSEESEEEDEEVLVEQSGSVFGFNVCEGCHENIDNPHSAFSCINQCGRSFHLECIRDPIFNQLMCSKCTGIRKNPTLATIQSESKHLLSSLVAQSHTSETNADTLYTIKSLSGWPQALKQVSGKTSKALCDNPDSDFIGSSSEEDEIEAGGVLVPQPPVRVGMAVIAEESHVLKDICPNEAHEEICRELLRHRWKKLSEEEGLDVENFPSLDATSERSLASLMGDFIERLIRGTMILAKKYMQAKKDSSADTLSSTFIIQTARVLNAPESVVQAAQIKSYRLNGFQRQIHRKRMGPRCNPSFKNVYRGKADQVKKWSVKNVSEFLQQIGLKHLVGPFSENEIDGSTFLELTVDDLKEDLGIIDEAAIGIVLTTISEISSHPNKRRR